ncbi:MAG: hypothetical protein NTX22_11630 [Ignavibacteriales bacterium]|nr:hypothetical protein [Ignavibacteriales bacterium]
MKFIVRTIAIVSISFVFFSCSSSKVSREFSISYNSFNRLIKIPLPTKEQLIKFNADINSELITVDKDGKKLTGYPTHNKIFLEEIISPVVVPYIDTLKKMKPSQMINALALFGHEIFQTYFGKDFYRWSGDIMDLDDPQIESIRYNKSYGLDCSGFSAMPYELAVYFGLLKPEQAVFSSKGFELYCKSSNVKDIGGREETSNNFRLETQELATLGREISSIPKGGSLNAEQINKLQAGDLVGRPGHFGIVVEINSQLYYLESGGSVVPPSGGNPYKASEAIKIFAAGGRLTIRRCLLD